MSSALPQLLRFISEIDGGAARARLQHAAEPQRAGQAERDLGLHVGELLLHQLIGGERPAELLAVERVLPRARASRIRRRPSRPRRCRSAHC